MSDLFATNVNDEKIQAVLSVVRRNPQHIFFVLTKNAPRLQRIAERVDDQTGPLLPENLWAGVSMPPSRMFGKQLDAHQKGAYMKRALQALAAVRKTGSKAKLWISFEPLSYPVASTLKGFMEYDELSVNHTLPLDWAVIGAASAGKKKFQPDAVDFKQLLEVLDGQKIPVFFKGNLHGNPLAEPWREEFPPEPDNDMAGWTEYRNEVNQEPGTYTPIAKFGQDHWSTLAYLETRAVDHKGIVKNENMRCNARLHRHFAHRIGLLGPKDDDKYPTRLADGETEARHDDWSCLEDMVAAGLLKAWFRNARPSEPFGGYECKVKITAVGQVITAMLREHKMEGGKWSDFHDVMYPKAKDDTQTTLSHD